MLFCVVIALGFLCCEPSRNLAVLIKIYLSCVQHPESYEGSTQENIPFPLWDVKDYNVIVQLGLHTSDSQMEHRYINEAIQTK